MQILLITNLYPPQELGGYGRCMADFSWGLIKLGHCITVLCSDAPYLGSGGNGPNGEGTIRRLSLKGNFSSGVQLLKNPSACEDIDKSNIFIVKKTLKDKKFDAVLLGNLDLLGAELLPALFMSRLPVLHHIGFVNPPFPVEEWPNAPHYIPIAASKAVRDCLINSGLPVSDAPIVHPGARVDLFGEKTTKRQLPALPNITNKRPLKVCYAGLKMYSKGPHTLLEAMALLKEKNIHIEAMLAGSEFQREYAEQLSEYCMKHELNSQVLFIPQLSRTQLARMFILNHACVFTSIHPEAFGIVPVEAMASGLALISTGVGGASEVFDDGISGLQFPAGDARSLANRLKLLATNPDLLSKLQTTGKALARKKFSVLKSAKQLEQIMSLKQL